MVSLKCYCCCVMVSLYVLLYDGVAGVLLLLYDGVAGVLLCDGIAGALLLLCVAYSPQLALPSNASRPNRFPLLVQSQSVAIFR